MKITKNQLKRIIKEELQLREGLQAGGLMELIKDELSRWHPQALDSLQSELGTEGFDLTQQVLLAIKELRGQP